MLAREPIADSRCAARHARPLNAVRRGHARLHRGLDIGAPSLVLRSHHTHPAPVWSEVSDRSRTVLDVAQIARWSGCLGNETTVVPVPGALHDVLLSRRKAREHTDTVIGDWLHRQQLSAAVPPAQGAAAS